MASSRLLSCVVIISTILLAQSSFAQSQWGGTSGNWDSAPNWHNGNVPNNSGESALLGGTNNYNVNYTSSLTIGGLSITNQLATLSFNTDGTTPQNRALFVNDDVLSNGIININSNNDTLGSTFNVDGIFTNSGTVRFGGSSDHEDSLRRLSAAEFLNNGAVTVNENAELRQTGGTVTNNGSFSIASGKKLEVHLPTFNNSGTILNSGQMELFSSTFNFNGGSITGNAVDINSTILNIGSTGSAQFNMYGFNPNTRLSGDIGENQTINIIPRNSDGNFFGVTFVHVDSDFTNNGLINFQSGDTHKVTLSGDVTLTNSATGTLRFGGSPGNTSVLRTLSTSLNNAGTVDVNENTEFFRAGAQLTNTGSINVAAGKELDLRIQTVNQNGGSIQNGGSVNFSNGVFNFNGGDITGNAIDLNSTQLNIGSGSGTGEFNLNGFNANTRLNGDIKSGQTVNIVPRSGGGATFVASDADFTNRGSLNLISDGNQNLTLQLNGTLTNEGNIGIMGGSTSGTNNRTLSLSLNNASGGVVDIDSLGPETMIGRAGANHSNSGTIINRNGGSSVTFIGDSFVNETDGVLKGNGEYRLQSGLVLDNFGTIDPGLSPGYLSFVGDVNLHSTSQLMIELGGINQGVDYDWLNVDGDVSLEGALSVDFISGFENQITSADTFTILTSNNLFGTFSGLSDGATFTTTDGKGMFTINYQGNNVVLSNFSAVPEPGSFGLLLVGLSALVVRRRPR